LNYSCKDLIVNFILGDRPTLLPSVCQLCQQPLIRKAVTHTLKVISVNGKLMLPAQHLQHLAHYSYQNLFRPCGSCTLQSF